MTQEIDIVTTNWKGLPAYRESGGGMSNTGEATLVAWKNWEKKKAIYERSKWHLSNENHALFVLNKGDIILNITRQDNNDWGNNLTLDRVVSLNPQEEKAKVENVIDTQYEEKKKGDRAVITIKDWDKIDDSLSDLISAAYNKVNCYHCRNSHYSK